MDPGPVISAIVNVDFAGTRTNGDTFQPCPRSRAAPRAGPSVDVPALPFSPVKFSGPIDRVFALEMRLKLPRFKSKPLKGESAAKSVELRPRVVDIRSNKRRVFFIVWFSGVRRSGFCSPAPLIQTWESLPR